MLRENFMRDYISHNPLFCTISHSCFLRGLSFFLFPVPFFSFLFIRLWFWPKRNWTFFHINRCTYIFIVYLLWWHLPGSLPGAVCCRPSLRSSGRPGSRRFRPASPRPTERVQTPTTWRSVTSCMIYGFASLLWQDVRVFPFKIFLHVIDY